MVVPIVRWAGGIEKKGAWWQGERQKGNGQRGGTGVARGVQKKKEMPLGELKKVYRLPNAFEGQPNENALRESHRAPGRKCPMIEALF